MHSSVFLDANRHVIRPALLWNDARTTSQCREITDRLGLDGLRSTVGNLALEGFTAPKVLWLREHEPENYERLRTLLLAKDYVRYRLTGELATGVPEGGFGEVVVRMGASTTFQTAASFSGHAIPTGTRVVVVEVDADGVLRVAPLDTDDLAESPEQVGLPPRLQTRA